MHQAAAKRTTILWIQSTVPLLRIVCPSAWRKLKVLMSRCLPPEIRVSSPKDLTSKQFFNQALRSRQLQLCELSDWRLNWRLLALQRIWAFGQGSDMYFQSLTDQLPFHWGVHYLRFRPDAYVTELVPGYGIKLLSKDLHEALAASRNSGTWLIRNLVGVFFTKSTLAKSSAYGGRLHASLDKPTLAACLSIMWILRYTCVYCGIMWALPALPRYVVPIHTSMLAAYTHST